MSRPSYRRLDVDERRRQLLERGAELFTSYPYEELSMSKIAAEVGISKALLYHYFPSKQAYFEETLSAWAEQLRERTEPDPDLPPVEQLKGSLDAFLALVGENEVAYKNLMQSAAGVAEIRALIEAILLLACVCLVTIPSSASGEVPQATLLPSGRAVAPPSAPPAVKAMIEAANRISHRPYAWGGGHRDWNARGYDCSGSVSYVLHAAGLLAATPLAP